MTLSIILSSGSVIPYKESISLAYNKKWCAENALLTVNAMAMFAAYDVTGASYVFAVNMNSPENKILYRIEDDTVIQSSMSEYSYRRFKSVYSNNKKYLIREAEEVRAHA